MCRYIANECLPLNDVHDFTYKIVRTSFRIEASMLKSKCCGFPYRELLGWDS